MRRAQRTQPDILPTQTGAKLPLARGGYFGLSSQPLHILLFLLPFMIFYELGSTGVIGEGVGATLAAQDMLVRFFDLFGVLGLHLPMLALVVTLLVQQLLSKASWKIHIGVLFAMLAESAFLTGPLIVLAVVIEPAAAAAIIQQIPSEPVSEGTSTLQGIYLAFGAGLYEELLFRLVLITMLHFIVSDVLGFKHTTGIIVGVALSAIAFAWHHNEVVIPGVGINWRLAVFYTLAGVYFGVLFVARGLGIAVGAHLMYDLLVFVIMPGIQNQE
jgi:hypothetical protein